jgi:uncharacterized protein (TIGR02757 family)
MNSQSEGLARNELAVKEHLNLLVKRYEHVDFIATDPISIPHGFDDPLDREIIGFYAAILAWGQRKTILSKLEELCERVGYRPYQFVFDYARNDGQHRLEGFVHRTFQPIDAHWMTRLLSLALRQYGSLNSVFVSFVEPGATDVGNAIDGFSRLLPTLDERTPARLRKHLARPSAGSSCKRLAMFLRWMVRSGPVDFGQWSGIDPSQLVLPLDVHSRRLAERFGALTRRSNDWKAVMEMTAFCRRLCPEDPARFDFAFYGPGAFGDDPSTASRISPTDR